MIKFQNIITVFGLVYCIHPWSLKLVNAQSSHCTAHLESFLLQSDKTLKSSEKSALISCLFSIQNKGFLYDEVECKYDSAYFMVESALIGWTALGDTLSRANLLKYLGYLNGRLGNFKAGKTQIQEAIQLYTTMGAAYGIAVSHFDLSKLYEYEGRLDSSVYHTVISNSYWSSQADTGRVMVLNTHLIHLASLTRNPEGIEKLIDTNLYYTERYNIYWQNILDFYFVTTEFYTSIGNLDSSNQYKLLYHKTISNLKREQGINGHSTYDPENCK